jgi:hypothetical protein
MFRTERSKGQRGLPLCRLLNSPTARRGTMKLLRTIGTWLVWLLFWWLLIPLALYASAKTAIPIQERYDRERYD